MKTALLFHVKGWAVPLILLVIISLAGCKEDEADDPAGEEVNQYLLGLPSWDQFCPQLLDTTELFDPATDFSCQDLTVITTTPASITRSPEDHSRAHLLHPPEPG
jgi:hypothetical protein